MALFERNDFANTMLAPTGSGETNEGVAPNRELGMIAETQHAPNFVNSLPVDVNDTPDHGDAFGDSERRLEEYCYDVNLFDSYGDGWNGNKLTILNSDTGATVHELTQ